MVKSYQKSGHSNGLELLKRIAENGVYYRSNRSEAFVDITINGTRRSFPVQHKQFNDWIIREAYNNNGEIPTTSQLRDLANVMAAKATFEAAPIYNVWRRVAEVEGAVYIDLCNNAYEVVRVTATDWEVVSNPHVRFQRLDGMRELPRPQKGGSVADLTDLLNLTHEQDAAILIAFCVHCLQPQHPYPILVLNGPKGSSKSTLTRTLIRLLDPNDDELKQFPRSEQDLAIALEERHLIAFDNVSNITQARSDMLARIATGGSFSTRKLYTDKDQIRIDLSNPLIMNGIPQFVDQPDLADRCLFIQLQAISPTKRITEAEYWHRFSEVQPRIFGLLLDGVSSMLANREKITLGELERMADFHRNAVASETTFWKEGTFYSAIQASKNRWRDDQLSQYPLAKAIINLANEAKAQSEDCTDWAGWTAWTGTVTALFKELEYLYEYRDISNVPKNVEQLGIMIKRLMPILSERGIGIERRRDKTSHRTRGYRIYFL